MTETSATRAAADEVLIDALATGRSHAEAAALIHRSAKTVQRRLADADFAARVRERRSQYYAEISGQLVGHAELAIGALAEIVDSDEGPYPRMRAADLLLTAALRFRASADQEERLRALETLIAERLQ